MSVYIYSTLSNNQLYKLDDDREILIAGRANVANKNLITPKGVMTAVDDDIYQQLVKVRVFEAHKRNGFITVSTAKADPEEVAKDMQAKDASAQATEEDIAEKTTAKVKK